LKVANEFTSIATGGGIAAELVQPTYDLAVRAALHSIPTARQFVTIRDERPAMRGSSITLEKMNFFAKAAIVAAKTPLTEEADVDSTKMPQPTPVVLTPAEYGFAVTTTRKLRNRVFADFDPMKAMAIALHQSRVLDELIQDKLVTGANKVWAGSNVADSTVALTDVLTATQVRRAVAKLRAGNAIPFFGNAYAGYVHPFTILDLRTETGAANWRDPNVYGQDQSNIWSGEIGMFEGVRFVENNLCRVTATGVDADGAGAGTRLTNVFQNYFLGRNTIAETVIEEPHVEFAPPVDKLNRFGTIGWYGDLGWSLYEPKALQRVLTSASVEADYVAE
jgi:N4-gp56 family major capsid protein